MPSVEEINRRVFEERGIKADPRPPDLTKLPKHLLESDAALLAEERRKKRYGPLLYRLYNTRQISLEKAEDLAARRPASPAG